MSSAFILLSNHLVNRQIDMNAKTVDLDELREVLSDYKPKVIAERTGLSAQTVYNFMNGSEENPSLDTVRKFLSFLNLQQIAIGTLQIQQLQ